MVAGVDAVGQQALQRNRLLDVVQAGHAEFAQRHECVHWLLADASDVAGAQIARAARELGLALVEHLLIVHGSTPALALPVRENVLQVPAIFVPFLFAVADSGGHRGVSALPSQSLAILGSFLTAVLRTLFLVIIVVLIIILVLVLFRIALFDMRSHRCQQILFILPFLLLFVNIWVRVFLLNHANLLLPDGVGRLF